MKSIEQNNSNNTFDYRGYTKDHLEQLCNSYIQQSPIVYWPSEVYSFGKIYRAYGFYPTHWPLYFYSSHGGSPDIAHKHELNNSAEFMLCFCKLHYDDFRRKCTKPCFQITAPYVIYRKMRNIQKSPFAQGTIIFPAHSTPNISNEQDFQLYIDQIKLLPQEFQPVCVCLHMHDINKGLHNTFIEQGIPVYSAGHAHDQDFVDRFYDIIRHFKYSMSNAIGSYTYYSVELGIPFSLFGPGAQMINVSDPNLPVGVFDIYAVDKPAHVLFQGLQYSITPEQHQYVTYNLGIDQGITRVDFVTLLHAAYRNRTFGSVTR